MKKSLFLIAFAVISLCASAQKVWIGGTVGVEVQNVKPDGSDSYKKTGFIAQPEIGVNLSDHFALAAEFAYSYAKVDKQKETMMGVGPYMRFTFNPDADVKFFAEVAGHYLSDKVSGSDAINGFNVQVRPGILVNLSDNWALVGKISLFEYDQFKDDDWKLTATGFTISTGLSVGFVYAF